MSMLRTLARRWADARLVCEADRLRRELIRAEAKADRKTQFANRIADGYQRMIVGLNAELNDARAERDEATATIKSLYERLAQQEDQIQRQANLFAEYRDEIDGLKRQLPPLLPVQDGRPQ